MPAKYIDTNLIKLGEAVFHDEPFPHPLKRGIVCPPDFFGRQDETQDIVSLLLDPSIRQPAVVQGERRAGKTSMLKLVRRKLRENYQDDVVVPEDILLGHIKGKTRPANEFLKWMVLNLCSELAIEAPTVPLDVCAEPTRAIAVFHELAKETQGRSIVFILDELDEIFEAKTTSEEDIQAFLTLIRRLRDSDPPVKFFFSIIRTQDRFKDHDTAVFFSEETNLKSLKPFDKDNEFRKLVQSFVPPPLSEASLSALHNGSGGWPYYLKVILSHVRLPVGPTRISQASTEASAQNDNFKWLMDLLWKFHFDEEEKKVIGMLTAHNPLGMSELIKSPSLPGAARRLVRRHYLREDEDDGFSLKIELLAAWFGIRSHEFTEPHASDTKFVVSATGSKIDSKRFRVAFSYTSDNRGFVENVAAPLAVKLGGEDRILLDTWHRAEFSMVGLDEYLPLLYREESKLIVIFLCANYWEREWCQLEWNKIQEVIEARPRDVMLFRFDKTEIPDRRATYFDVGNSSSYEIAKQIMKRLGE